MTLGLMAVGTLFFLALLLLSVKNPKLMFYITVIILFVWPSFIVYKAGALPGMTLDRIFLLCLVVSLLVHLLLYSHAIKIKFYAKEIFIIFLMFFWMLLSTLFAENMMKSVFASINWFLSGPFLLIYLVFFLKTTKDIKNITIAILFAFMTVNLLGLIEMLNNAPLFNNYLITETENTLNSGVEKLRDGAYRLQSVFSNPLVYSQILVASIPIWLNSFWSSKQTALKIILLFNIIITYILIYKTGSRAGLALAIGIPILFFYINLYKRKKYLLLRTFVNFIMLPLLLLFLAVNIYKEFDMADQLHTLNMKGLIKQEEVSSLARVLQIKLGLGVIAKHPIVGQGQGEALRELPSLHAIDNYYLTITLSIGIVGLLLWLYFLWRIFRIGTRGVKHFNNNDIKYYTLSFLIILIYYMILSIDKGNNLLFILAGLILIQYRLLYSKESEKVRNT